MTLYIVNVALYSSVAADDESKDLYFDQKLDHFAKEETSRWKQVEMGDMPQALWLLQRYWRNDQFYMNGGPIILRIGSNLAESSVNIYDEQMPAVKFARELNASLVFLEMRFYGKSHPTP